MIIRERKSPFTDDPDTQSSSYNSSGSDPELDDDKSMFKMDQCDQGGSFNPFNPASFSVIGGKEYLAGLATQNQCTNII